MTDIVGSVRTVFLFGALAAAGSAMASFDLLLVLDSAQNVVHRYDGATGTYLGRFGEGLMTNVRGIGVDKNTKIAYVTMQNGYSAWDVSTGEMLFYNDRAGSTWGDVFVTDSGRLLLASTVSSTNGALIMSNLTATATGTPLITANIPAVSSTSFQFGNGSYFTVRPPASHVSRHSSTTFQDMGQGSSSTLINGSSRGDVDGDLFVGLRPNGATFTIRSIGNASASTSLDLGNPFTSAVEFAAAHPGFGWGLGTNASGVRIQRYARNGSDFYNPVGSGRTLSQVTTPAGLAVVIAPEPGTMTALGLGALALLRRRKKR